MFQPRRSMAFGPLATAPLARRGAWVVLVLGGLVGGCREAVTRPNPSPIGSAGPPFVVVAPGQDTTVDSIGTLNIRVAVHDQALIDSVAIIITGAPLAFPADFPNDTVFQAGYPVPLAPLHHQAFSFAVHASNILGYDTTTATVNVRLR